MSSLFWLKDKSRTDLEEQGDPIEVIRKSSRGYWNSHRLTSLRPAVLISVSKMAHSITWVPDIPLRGCEYQLSSPELMHLCIQLADPDVLQM